MSQRMILTQKEMVFNSIAMEAYNIENVMLVMTDISLLQEEVVLKRCWLARYWGLAAKYGT